MVWQRPDPARLKQAAQNIKTALRQMEAITADSRKLEQEVRQTARALGEEQLVQFLRGLGVDELNRDKRGIRVAALKAAGIENLAQLYGRSPGALERIEGIGAANAAVIYSVVQTIAASAREGMRLRLSVEDKSQHLKDLLVLLHRYEAAARPRLAAEELLADFGEELQNALRGVGRALNLLRWLFSSAGDRQQAIQAAEELLALDRCGITEKAEQIHRDFLASAPVGDAMEAFAKNSAPFAVTLETISGLSAADAAGAVPAPLAREVSARKLDLSLLNATLRPYQHFGTQYILHQKRCLLGDEMGLGKTMQAIAAMASLTAEGGSHFLVVCPASVLVNWCREIARHSRLRVQEIHGSDKLDELLLWRKEGGVAVTTYETARSLVLPEGFRLDMLVADEAHYVKNPLALRTRTMMRLCAASRHVLFMTGTPLENKADEMCALLDMLDAPTAQKARELKYLSHAPRFREAIASVYLRRTREDVLTELPEKLEKEQWCRPTAQDLQLYFAQILDRNFMGMRRVGWQAAELSRCSKAQRLRELIDQARQEGRKVLVFSFFRDTAQRVLELAGENAFGPINGSVPSARRQEIVDAFSDAPEGAVLVCQITAGGTGLNIQAASVVIFCEPQIKPSLETQAISRAYRMGQARTVLVHRLLCENTIDEQMLTRLRDKQELFDSFADVSVAGAQSLADADMRVWVDALIDRERQRLQQDPALSGSGVLLSDPL